MSYAFFEKPILNSPYLCPSSHWELDSNGQPTNQKILTRRKSELISPLPKPKSRKLNHDQANMTFDRHPESAKDNQEYNPTPIINEIRSYVDAWRNLQNPDDWRVTLETAHLLQHWRRDDFRNIRPFFCQVEAIETVIWLKEVAPKISSQGTRFVNYLKSANREANPDLFRIALKLCTGAGKTTVMAMIIAWQAVNAIRNPKSSFSRGFLVISPGITIRDRLGVLLPNSPDSYYRSRDLVPTDMLPDINKAAVVVTNFHSFKLREKAKIHKNTRRLIEGGGMRLVLWKQKER